MKIEKELDNYIENLDDKVIDIVNKTLNDAFENLIDRAPVDTGSYISSIKIEKAHTDGNKIVGSVYSDMSVYTKDGKEYVLADLLENGTLEHAIPNAFGWGDIYGYDSPQYRRTLEPDWHPGTSPQPHWQPTYEDAEVELDNLIKENL